MYKTYKYYKGNVTISLFFIVSELSIKRLESCFFFITDCGSVGVGKACRMRVKTVHEKKYTYKSFIFLNFYKRSYKYIFCVGCLGSYSELKMTFYLLNTHEEK